MDDRDTSVRPYDAGDADDLWDLKRAFERELAAGTGDAAKADRYEAKLTAAYRDRYLSWVERCVDGSPDCLQVAVAGGDDGPEGAAGADGPVGYAFLLPSSLAMIWDAAVLNELYVRPGARGTGVADALLSTVVATARGQDLPLDRLVLDVDADNDRARAFYERHGFEPWGKMVARPL